MPFSFSPAQLSTFVEAQRQIQSAIDQLALVADQLMSIPFPSEDETPDDTPPLQALGEIIDFLTYASCALTTFLPKEEPTS